ncbi:MAG: anhydro-N-acetylmuramic acid kinase [Micavibrio aeruginosavorus]|uniref:Anhydro-N-acetylmuramic acid kinase n=1 Tax=Micavibrio aeruginosavorus TaxID=349221 RepID=A0A7T5R3H7_9BACT|nr:MAG: anhydro-N-acetylmuramic acid kinase [Micavibrio aeruginosavorus]
MQKPSVNHKIHTAIGLMSGTSLDGIDAALIRTDGADFVEPLAFLTLPYEPAVRDSLRACLGLSSDPDGRVGRAEALMTDAHAQAVKTLLALAHVRADQVDLIGFHGQTIFHDPDNGFTWQIGDGAKLAQDTGIAVVNDFRSNDVKAGGQGAPLIPVYHAALASRLPKPVAILNIGGVANVTFIDDQNHVLAFDTGPGNALINDWVRARTGEEFDKGGAYARAGQIDGAALSRLLQNPFFAAKPPKSLDRDAWNTAFLQGFSLEDGAATLSAFTVQAVAQAVSHMPQNPKAWYVTGGGRLNLAIMEGLRSALKAPVYDVDTLQWDGDALEAQGFAYLAVRSRLQLPLSFPSTTAVPKPMTGGRFWALP